jgi:hypothetical protein
MTSNIQKQHTHIIQFSYQQVEGGKLCDLTGEIFCCLDDEWVKKCDAELEEMKYGNASNQNQWNSLTRRVLHIEMLVESHSYDVEKMENITWGNIKKIYKCLDIELEYKEYEIILLYPSGRYSDDGKWFHSGRTDIIEAKNEEEAKSIAQRKLFDRKYDATLIIPKEVGVVDDCFPISPYISSIKLSP